MSDIDPKTAAHIECFQQLLAAREALQEIASKTSDPNARRRAGRALDGDKPLPGPPSPPWVPGVNAPRAWNGSEANVAAHEAEMRRLLDERIRESDPKSHLRSGYVHPQFHKQVVEKTRNEAIEAAAKILDNEERICRKQAKETGYARLSRRHQLEAAAGFAKSIAAQIRRLVTEPADSSSPDTEGSNAP